MSSSTTHPYQSGTSHALEHQQLFFQQQNQHGTDIYHVPQHSRREKLRFSNEESPIPLVSLYTPHFLAHSSPVVPPESLPVPYNQMGCNQTGFSLSLSSSSPNNQRRNVSSGVPGPYGPFTGYAAVLGRSRFLGPARLLLEEICDVGRRDMTQEMDMSGGDGGMLGLDPSERESLSAVDSGSGGSREGSEFHWKKSRLISMMEEVCKRYKQYYQQVQAVITSFESVAGLSNAAPFAAMALKAMSKHFKCLKSAILNQLKNTNKANGKEALNRDEMPSFGLLSGGAAGGQRGNNMASFGQPHIWRPQRGLPERAVSVLRAWLFEHFLHPYPTDTDKQMLSKQTGLTRNQVSNWFINARVRLWKPMVEEIHNLEMRQLHKHSSNEKNTNLNPNGFHPNQPQSNCSHSNPSDLLQGQISTTNTKNPNPNSSTSRSIQAGELSQIPNSVHEPMNFSYNGFFNGGNVNPNGVSLTLGLHQNNRVCLTESIPANLVHRFGLEDCNDPYVIGSFEAHGRPFGKDMSGHLLHDFVG